MAKVQVNKEVVETVEVEVVEVENKINVDKPEVILEPEKIEQLSTMIDDIFAKQIDLDNSKINLYVLMIDMFKASSNKDKLEEVLISNVNVRSKKNNVSKAYTNKVKNIVKISKLSVIYDLYLFEGRSTNVKAYFYNIEKLVRLFEYLHLNYTVEETKVVRKDLNKLIKIADKKEYNDTLAKALTDLFKKYKIVLSDSGAIVKITLTSEGIASFLKTLTPEQLEMVLNQATELDKENKAK